CSCSCAAGSRRFMNGGVEHGVPAEPGGERVARNATRQMAVALILTTASALGLTVLYGLGGQSQIEGILLALALGGPGFAFAVASRKLLPQGPFVENREQLASTDADVHDFERDFGRLFEDPDASGGGDRAVARRRFLARMFAAAGGALGLAALFPIASLG